ncbi:hypothetical protein HPP92_014075 [Vanilla planifolia]|uniref:Uncharacterized protein n=1 Tax=Vanilla planifolia TaxID=51239 RepID=A0A835QQW9_VANPL|nr:hypothetical protein HPP92_014075 [Vanilla planifolia]
MKQKHDRQMAKHRGKDDVAIKTKPAIEQIETSNQAQSHLQRRFLLGTNSKTIFQRLSGGLRHGKKETERSDNSRIPPRNLPPPSPCTARFRFRSFSCPQVHYPNPTAGRVNATHFIT